MEQIKEENRSLIASRNNYYTVIVTITAGLIWLLLSNISMAKFCVLFVLGVYFDLLYIVRLQNADNRIENNIKRLK